MPYGKYFEQKNKFKISSRSAFQIYHAQPKRFCAYNTFMELFESGEVKIATKDNQILTPAEAIMYFETLQITVVDGVVKVLK